MNVIQCVQILLEERKGELGIGLSNNARYTMHNITVEVTQCTTLQVGIQCTTLLVVVGTQCTTLLVVVGTQCTTLLVE